MQRVIFLRIFCKEGVAECGRTIRISAVTTFSEILARSPSWSFDGLAIFGTDQSESDRVNRRKQNARKCKLTR